MPFTFIDIEKKQSRKIIMLFFTLVVFYFAGSLLLYWALKASSLFDLFLRLSGYFDYRLRFKSESYRIIPRWDTLLILLSISFFAAYIHWKIATNNMIKKILNVINAVPIDPEDRYHLLFKNIIDEVSIATGGIKIEPYVISSRHLNAFALSDFHGRSVIGITEGLLTKLKRNQLEGVVAHEAAHLVWGDCLLSTVSCSMANVYAGKLRTEHFYMLMRLPLQMIPIIIAIFILRFLTLFLNTWISREREIRADATAVRLTRNPLSLAEPLYLISKNWRGNSLPSEELSPIFIVSPREKKLEQSRGFFADLFTTHPPIKQRLDNLLDMAHINYAILESNTKEKPKTKQEEIPIACSEAENEKIWYALNSKNWEGPFCLKELIHLKYLGPFTWITKARDTKVKSAFEYKEINTLLENRHSCSLIVHSCPACNQNLEKVYYKGALIWKCTHCKGHLIDNDRLLRIIVRENTIFSDEVKEKAKQIILSSIKQKAKYTEGSKSSLKCPCCENIMHRTIYGSLYPYRVEIDTCQNCNLVWLDNKELEIIQHIIEITY